MPSRSLRPPRMSLKTVARMLQPNPLSLPSTRRPSNCRHRAPDRFLRPDSRFIQVRTGRKAEFTAPSELWKTPQWSEDRSIGVRDLHPSAPTANRPDFPATPNAPRGRFVNVNATPRYPIFNQQRVNEPRWATRPDGYNAGSRNGFGLDDNVYQALLQNRIIFLGSEVKDENANAICAQMLLLNAEDPQKDI